MTARDVIAQALALSEAATEGPWHHEPYGGQNQNGDYSGGHIFDADGDYVVPEVRDVDGALIAPARTLLPAFAKALGGVLDVTTRDLDASPDYEERLWDQGFNAALGDVHAAITAALSEVTP